MCTNLAFIPLVYFCYPETTNLTLEEVDYLFVKKEEGGGRKGLQRTEPVRASLEGDVEKGSEALHLEVSGARTEMEERR